MFCWYKVMDVNRLVAWQPAALDPSWNSTHIYYFPDPDSGHYERHVLNFDEDKDGVYTAGSLTLSAHQLEPSIEAFIQPHDSTPSAPKQLPLDCPSQVIVTQWSSTGTSARPPPLSQHSAQAQAPPLGPTPQPT